MGNDYKFGIGHAEAVTGVVARLVTTFCSGFDLLALLIAGVREAAVRTGRAVDAVRHKRPLYYAWSIPSGDRPGVPVGNALPRAVAQSMEKSRLNNIDSIRKHLRNIEKFVSFFLAKIANTDLKQNCISDLRNVFMSLASWAWYLGRRSTNATSPYMAAGSDKFTFRAEGYLIPT